MANKDTVKAWFETGDFPTQDQFYQKFEWLRWKDELLSISDVTDLQTVLNTLNAAIGGSATVVQMHVAGATVNMNADTTWLIVKPASTIPALQIIFPVAPVDAQRIDITFGGADNSLAVTSLVCEILGGASFRDGAFPSGLIAGESLTYKYNAADTTWYRMDETKSTGGGGGGTGAAILFGAGVPSNALGIDGDVYIDTVAPNNLYKKVAGAYVLQTALQGAAGATGATGPAGPSVWGGISGTLSTQTDLQNALNAKTTDVLAGYVSGAGTVANGDTIKQALQKIEGSIVANQIIINQKILSIAGNYSQSIT